MKLRNLPAGDDPDAKLRNGIEFRWSPPGIAGANSACLSYSVWLPDKFEFGGGGVLPGVFGGEPAAPRQRAVNDRLAVTLEWSAEGQPSLVAAVDGGEHSRMSGTNFSLPTNRWTKIEQEIVLNDPNQPNGVVRLWVDGELIGRRRQGTVAQGRQGAADRRPHRDRLRARAAEAAACCRFPP